MAALILPCATRWQRRGSRIDGFDDLEVFELLAGLRLLGWLQFLAGAWCVAVAVWRWRSSGRPRHDRAS